jgi:transketolase
MGHQKADIEQLVQLSKKIRLVALEMIYKAGSGHPGPCLSVADIITALYFYEANLNSEDPHWDERDRIIVSKGHGAPTLYAALGELEYFDREELKKFRQLGGILQGHPDLKMIPGVDMTTGALGNGLSIGIGMALASRITGKKYRVYIVLGDGECQEGQVWEAAIAGSTRKVSNLVAIVDRNRFNQTACTEDCGELEPFEEKWKAFGWEVKSIDGHNLKELTGALDWARTVEHKPAAIIANTTKGKGISFIEGNPEWHSHAITEEQIEQIRNELGFRSGEWLQK